MDEYELSKKKTVRYHKLKKLLKNTYGYDNFKSHQYEIINKAINGENVCAILPTGYGKSLTFQLPAIYIGKPAIIISPLISLMDDQRITLEKLGLTSCCFNSTISDKTQLKKDILKNKYQFIYITPESVVKSESLLKELNEKVGISVIGIDEAHCISSYGFVFRPAYRGLSVFKDI